MHKIITGIILAGAVTLTLPQAASARSHGFFHHSDSSSSSSTGYASSERSSDYGSRSDSSYPDYGESTSSTRTTESTESGLVPQVHQKRHPHRQNIQLAIDGRILNVKWENNQAVSELKELARSQPLILNGRIFGAMEQTARLPRTLTTADNTSMTAQPGDIMLYEGRQFVVFFGNNTWDYTRMGRIEGLTHEDLEKLLNKESVVIKLLL